MRQGIGVSAVYPRLSWKLNIPECTRAPTRGRHLTVAEPGRWDFHPLYKDVGLSLSRLAFA